MLPIKSLSCLIPGNHFNIFLELELVNRVRIVEKWEYTKLQENLLRKLEL